MFSLVRNAGFLAVAAITLATVMPAQSLAHDCASNRCNTCIRWNTSGQCSQCVPRPYCLKSRIPTSLIVKRPPPVLKGMRSAVKRALLRR
jgi:hypothetical protein